MIIGKFIQLILTTLAGIIVPARVVVPESTLVPPAEVLVAYQEQEQVIIIPQKSREELLPAYLYIPSIGVNAAIDPVGLTDKGAVDTPTEPELIGWFDVSAIPGETGTAIVDGHRGWRDDIDAVFDNLNQLDVGDTVIIINNEGATIPFEVYDKKTYLPDESPSEVFIASEEGSFLNLITCNGEWDTETHSATERLVVFTRKIDR